MYKMTKLSFTLHGHRMGHHKGWPTLPVALHRGRARGADAGLVAQLEARGRTMLWAAFALGSGLPDAAAPDPLFPGAGGWVLVQCRVGTCAEWRVCMSHFAFGRWSG